MAKRLVVCCDGTWDSPDELNDGTPTPTNVTKIALALAAKDAGGTEQRVFYRLGVGTRRRQRVSGGMFGLGVSRAVRDTYAFLVQNYEPGDELYFFGFSRGAFTARSTAGFVRNSGILHRENAGLIDRAFALYRRRGDKTAPKSLEASLFRRSYSYEPRIRFIGVWDTVGALGIPLTESALVDLINWRSRFHDTSLSSTVDAAFQALAIDEKRGAFRPALWENVPENQRVEQVWFTGVHRDVGGGYPEHELSDITLLWMMARARECGLAFVDGTSSASLSRAASTLDNKELQSAVVAEPNPLAAPHNSLTSFYRLLPRYGRKLGIADRIHEFAASTAVQHLNGRPEDLSPGLVTYLDGRGQVKNVEADVKS
jgi:uncharacterized protein (DUF2235 family)